MFFLIDPCLNHHCKKGKVCEVDDSNQPMCVCQDPLTCPAPVGDFEHVCVFTHFLLFTSVSCLHMCSDSNA